MLFDQMALSETLTNTFWFFSQLFSCSFGQRLEREKEHRQNVSSKPLSSKWNIKIQEKPWVPTFSEPWKRVKDIQQLSKHWTKKENAKMVRTFHGIFTHTSSFPSMAWHCHRRGKWSLCAHVELWPFILAGIEKPFITNHNVCLL